jgi:AcrR family transcriptional regulator
MEEDSENQIMEATYRAFCEHGYAELSIQKIADEFDKGKSLIYYHYDDKEDLMLSFLDYMMDKAQMEGNEAEPAEQIDMMLDKALGIEDEEQWQFQKAFQEFRVQAQHNEKFQEKFREADKVFLDDISDIMEETGAKDPEVAAEIFLSMVEGSISRKVSTGDREGLEELKNDIKKTISPFFEEDCCL